MVVIQFFLTIGFERWINDSKYGLTEAIKFFSSKFIGDCFKSELFLKFLKAKVQRENETGSNLRKCFTTKDGTGPNSKFKEQYQSYQDDIKEGCLFSTI